MRNQKVGKWNKKMKNKKNKKKKDKSIRINNRASACFTTRDVHNADAIVILAGKEK